MVNCGANSNFEVKLMIVMKTQQNINFVGKYSQILRLSDMILIPILNTNTITDTNT